MPSPMSAYAKQSREALAKAIRKLDRRYTSANGQLEAAQTRFDGLKTVGMRLVGAVGTGPLSAGATGYLETRFPSRDGSPLSLGPVPLSGVIGTLATVGAALPWAGAEQSSYVAASNLGLAAGTLGRKAGIAGRAKSLLKQVPTAAREAVRISGDGHEGLGYGFDQEEHVEAEDEWSPAERELLGV